MVAGTPWFNADGLYVEFGTTKAANETAGEYKTFGDLREVHLLLDLTTLTSTPAIVSNTLKFPTGCKIQEIIVIADTAATSGGSATLDLGLQKEDRATEIDYNGFIAALAKTAYDAAGEQNTINVGGTGAGALMGTSTTDVGYLTANYNTAAYTAGVLKIKIRYYNNSTITQ